MTRKGYDKDLQNHEWYIERLDRDQVFIASSRTKTVEDQIKLRGAALENNERVSFM